MGTCWYCGEAIEWRDGFGWKAADGYTCWHRHGGRMMGEGHEPEGDAR